MLDGIVGNRVNEVPESNTRLHFSFEPDQNRFRHVQRHDPRRGSKGNEAGARGKRDPYGEAGVGIAAGAYGVRQQHTIEPAVDDAVAGSQRDAPAGHDEIGQRVLSINVDRLGVGRSVAEGLHG